jgi:hypothetical protein
MIRSLTLSGVETAGSEMVEERKGGLLQPLGFAEIEATLLERNGSHDEPRTRDLCRDS